MSSYRAVLRTPYACRVFAAALLGRSSYGIIGLSLILALTGTTHSYAVAGGVMALFSLTVSALSPVRAGLIDRYGPQRALPPMAVAYALVLLGMAAATWRPGTPGPLLAAVAVAAGTCAPPLGPVTRTLWSELLPDPALLRRGYGLDTVAEELLFVVGPLVAGLIARLSTPSAGIVLSAMLVPAGTFALVASAPVRGLTVAPAPRRRRGGGVAVVRPMVAALGIGMCLGAIELLMVAFAGRHHDATAVAWCSAALSAGSAVGGLVYGALPRRAPLAALVALPGLGLLLAGLSPGVHALAGVAGATGLFISPAMATAYLVADESVDRRSRTQAGAWVNTAINAGSSGGTALAGLLLTRLPASVCFAAAAAPVLLAAAITLALPAVRRRRPRVDPDSPRVVSGAAFGGDGSSGMTPSR